MASLITRGAPDVLIDRIVSALVASEAEQSALDPLVSYAVFRDNFEPLPRLKANRKPLVNVYFQQLTPAQGGTSSNGAYQESVAVMVDMIVNEPDPAAIPENTTADQIAEARLHYLREQIRVPLFDLKNRRFGFDTGTLGNISSPTYTKLENDDENAETALVAGRWSFTIECPWSAVDLEGVPLEEISIDTSLFKALYVYPEEP